MSVTVEQIEKRAKKIGMSIAELLRCADVSPSTWTRNKQGKHNFNTSTLKRIIEKLESAERSKSKGIRHVQKRICINAHSGI